MKNISLLFLIFLSIHCYAFEIHCQTDHVELEFVLKKSPESGRAYALLFTPEDLLEYLPLDSNYLTYQPGESFHYLEQIDSLSFEVLIDFNDNRRRIQLPFKKAEILALHSCQEITEIYNP